VTASVLRERPSRDPVLAKVLDFTVNGWPIKLDKGEIKPYFDRRLELTVEQGCLMWGTRVIIPLSLRSKVMDELHGGHLGIVKMKELARSHLWWPGLDQDIESAIGTCDGCQSMKQDAKLTPVHPWEFPEGPWRRLHIDFAGPFEGKMFMVVIDAFSKWPEVAIMERTTAEDTIEKLRDMFARWGIPTQLVSDNGPQFTSEMFERFTRANNIKHTTTSPYHPATNGLAERFVQTLKQALRVSRKDGRTLNGRLNIFLISYRNARHSTTERSLAQLLLGRDLRSRLHLLKPNLRDTVLRNQTRQVQTRSAATERESLGLESK
jgi:hypothetical protein